MAYTAIEIARKILAKADPEDLISNLKLQKMLYYQQGFHLAYFGEPLFEEEIEAWMYGPAVPSIYDHFCSNGSNGIPFNGNIIALSDEEESLFNEVFKVYNDYTAIGLMNLSHNESPWKSTPTGRGSIISREKMEKYFKTRLR